MNKNLPLLTMDKMYIPPFTGQRMYDSDGRTYIQPIERKMNPTGVEVIDHLLQLLAAGKSRTEILAHYDLSTVDMNSVCRFLTGMTLTELCFHYSTRLMEDLLRYTDLPLKDVAKRSGFGTLNNMYYLMRRRDNPSIAERRRRLRQKGDVGKYVL